MGLFKPAVSRPEHHPVYRIMLPMERTGIPALRTFGHTAGPEAGLPMIEHRHKDKFEFVLLVKGIQQHMVSGVSYTLYGGQAFAVRPNEPHSCVQNCGEYSELLWFQLDAFGPEGFLGLSGRDGQTLYDLLTGFSARQFELSRRLIRLFLEAFELLSGLDCQMRMKGRALFLFCLLNLLESSAVVTALSDPIDKAKQYILRHIQEAIDMDELLLASGLPMAEFREEFSAQIGMTPREFIQVQKVEASRPLVAAGMTPADVAYEFHFSSPSYFKLLFKRVMGMSMKQYYRKSQKEKEEKQLLVK